MSFSVPSGRGPVPQRRQTNAEQQRIASSEAENYYIHQRNDLKAVAAKQAKRIEELKLNTAVQLEHQSTLRRLDLEERRISADEAVSQLTPRLEVIRSQWNHTKEQNQGYELQWGSMRGQLQQAKSRVDILKDQIADGRQSIENDRTSLNQMREHLHRLDRDKAQLRGKIKQSLECLVIDEQFLQTRVSEEENYATKLNQALHAMDTEYKDSQAQYQHEFAPLEEDVTVLSQYLEEMQARTKSLERYCLELEGKASSTEEHWLENVHAIFEGVERSNNQDQLKNAVIKYLEAQCFDSKEHAVGPPLGRSGHMDAYWLTNAVAVWEGIVREVVTERQKMQIRDDNARLVAETSQKCQQAKAHLGAIREKVYDNGTHRRQLFMEISDLHYLLHEKKESEEDLIHVVQEEATKLDEDLSAVLQLIRKEGFDDYVSSTDEEAPTVQTESDEGFHAMKEEGTDDIAAIVSSMDLDPDDPASAEALKRMEHRPEGPLKEFAARRSMYLQKSATGPGMGASRPKGSVMETLERALMDVQVQVSGEVIGFVRNRRQSIQAGNLDPKVERINADPRYVARAREISSRVDRWVEEHKDSDQLRISKPQGGQAGNSGASGLHTQSGQAVGDKPIVIEGAKIPPDVVRADPIAKLVYYTNHAVRGHNFTMYMRRSMGPELRQVFLSRNFNRLVGRRVGGDGNDENVFIRLADVTNILTGHKTDVFRDMKAASRHPMRPELAFSIITHLGTTFDLECDSIEDRNYWAHIFAWVVNESRRGGNLAALTRENRISVVDSMNRTGSNEEPRDRSYLNVQIHA